MGIYPKVWIDGVLCNSVSDGYGLHPSHPPRAIGAPSVQSVSVPGQHGELWTPQGVHLAPLFVVTLRIVGAGSTIDQRYAHVEQLVRTLTRVAMNPRLQLRQQVAASGLGSTLYADARLYSPPVREREFEGNLEVEKLTMTFQIPSGFWSDSPSGAPSFTTTITSPTMGASYVIDSTASTGPLLDAQIRVRGPIVNPQFTDTQSGDWVRYAGTIPSGTQIRFDLARFKALTSTSWATEEWNATGTDVSALMYLGGIARDYSPTMVRLQPGFVVLSGAASLTGIEGTLTGTGTNSNTRLEVRGRRAYV